MRNICEKTCSVIYKAFWFSIKTPSTSGETPVYRVILTECLIVEECTQESSQFDGCMTSRELRFIII